jgi:hypothetical protein
VGVCVGGGGGKGRASKGSGGARGRGFALVRAGPDAARAARRGAARCAPGAPAAPPTRMPATASSNAGIAWGMRGRGKAGRGARLPQLGTPRAPTPTPPPASGAPPPRPARTRRARPGLRCCRCASPGTPWCSRTVGGGSPGGGVLFSGMGGVRAGRRRAGAGRRAVAGSSAGPAAPRSPQCAQRTMLTQWTDTRSPRRGAAPSPARTSWGRGGGAGGGVARRRGGGGRAPRLAAAARVRAPAARPCTWTRSPLSVVTKGGGSAAAAARGDRGAAARSAAPAASAARRRSAGAEAAASAAPPPAARQAPARAAGRRPAANVCCSWAPLLPCAARWPAGGLAGAAIGPKAR